MPLAHQGDDCIDAGTGDGHGCVDAALGVCTGSADDGLGDGADPAASPLKTLTASILS